MSNPTLLSSLFCFFLALSEGVCIYFNIFLNSGPIFVKEQFQSLQRSSLVMVQCYSSSIPCVGFFLSWVVQAGAPCRAAKI